MDGWCSNGANCFALVSYLPDPIASFVDRLRSELAPGCRLRAHITVLPPRPIDGDPEAAWQELRQGFQGLAPFLVQLEEVRSFQVSEVVYLSVGTGREELERVNGGLNQGRALFREAFSYHPHVTLAQDLDPAQVAGVLELATRRWREYTGPRSFTLERLTFVQNQAGQAWSDLAECELPPPVLV